MIKINENYLKLPGSYLFSAIAKKVKAYQEAHPEADIIRLGIGDVTLPLAPSVIKALHEAVDEMGQAETFHGYAPDLGYSFLREEIAKKDYQDRGCSIQADEIFISDGAKCDCGNIQELFDETARIAVCDPDVYKRQDGVWTGNGSDWSGHFLRSGRTKCFRSGKHNRIMTEGVLSFREEILYHIL